MAATAQHSLATSVAEIAQQPCRAIAEVLRPNLRRCRELVAAIAQASVAIAPRLYLESVAATDLESVVVIVLESVETVPRPCPASTEAIAQVSVAMAET